MSNVTVKITDTPLNIRFPVSVPGPAGTAPAASGSVLISGTEASSQILTTGNGKAAFRISPAVNGANLTYCAAAVTSASSSGPVTVQIRRLRAGVSADMLSTPLTIDAGETDTLTAAVPVVINTSNDDVQTGDIIFFDVDTAGTDVLGLIVSFTFSE